MMTDASKPTEDVAATAVETPEENLLLRTRTTTTRSWLLKQVAYVVVLLGFGVWGLADALWIYPQQGKAAADHAEMVYLEAWRTAGGMEKPGVADPAAALADLSARAEGLSGVAKARYNWLYALSTAWQLTPANTAIADANARYAELSQRFQREPAREPKNPWDIPLQWLIAAAGFVGGLWCLVVLARVLTTKYGWEYEPRRLRLPSGATLVPGDIEEFDKRKWHKFIIFLRVKEGHAQLGGRELKLDLLPFTPLEAWVLEMERVAFPESVSGLEGLKAREAAEKPVGAL